MVLINKRLKPDNYIEKIEGKIVMAGCENKKILTIRLIVRLMKDG